MTRAQYRRFRADLLQWAKVYKKKISPASSSGEPWTRSWEGNPIEFTSALKSTRKQMALLRKAYYKGCIY